jgi:hypothetical protein
LADIRYIELKVIELNATWIAGENKILGKYFWAIEKSITLLGKKNGSTEHSKRNKTVPEKVATARTDDGHK